MFEFLNMMGNYDARKVGHDEFNDTEGNLTVLDTAMVTDSAFPYETALSSNLYKGGKWIIVAQYNTESEAKEGHDHLLEKYKTNDMPDEIWDIYAGFEDWFDSKGHMVKKNG